MKHRAAIMDLDGTLLNTLEDLAYACNQVLAEHGFPTHPADDYRELIGDGIFSLVRRALPAEAVEANGVDGYVAQIRAVYDTAWKRTTQPYPGIMDMLVELQRRGAALAVLSNKPHGPTVEVVGHFFGKVGFREVIGAKPEVPMKPDPAGALALIGRLGLAPADCVYLGDTGTDMKTGVNAGMLPVGAGWGFRPDELDRAGAEMIIDHPARLLELF